MTWLDIENFEPSGLLTGPLSYAESFAVNLAKGALSAAKQGKLLIDTQINTGYALQELKDIIKTTLDDNDLLTKMTDWDAAYKNALIYDSTLLDLLSAQEAEHSLAQQQARSRVFERSRLDAGYQPQSQAPWVPTLGEEVSIQSASLDGDVLIRRYCLAIAHLLTLRQTRVDANTEALRDLTMAQEDALKKTLSDYSGVADGSGLPPGLSHFQKFVAIGRKKIAEKRYQLLQQQEASLTRRDQLELATTRQGLTSHPSPIEQEKMKMTAKNLQVECKFFDQITEQLSVVDISDSNYCAAVQRSMAIARLLDKSRGLQEVSTKFQQGATGLRHLTQGQNLVLCGGCFIVGGVLIGIATGGIGYVPLVGGHLAHALGWLTWIMQGVGLLQIGVGTYHCYWNELAGLKKAITERISMCRQQQEKNHPIAAGRLSAVTGFLSNTWHKTMSLTSFGLGAANSGVSHLAYQYMMKVSASDTRAKLLQSLKTQLESEYTIKIQARDKWAEGQQTEINFWKCETSRLHSEVNHLKQQLAQKTPPKTTSWFGSKK